MTTQYRDLCELSEAEAAAVEAREAIKFYDRVIASDGDERMAVGTDHTAWVLSALRRVAATAPTKSGECVADLSDPSPAAPADLPGTPTDWVATPQNAAVAAFLNCVLGELGFIAQRFPGNEVNHAALVEEVGEAAKAFIDHNYHKGDGYEIFFELVQVAAVACKNAVCGSGGFIYEPKPEQFAHEFGVHLRARCEAMGLVPPIRSKVPTPVGPKLSTKARCTASALHIGLDEIEALVDGEWRVIGHIRLNDGKPEVSGAIVK